MNRSLRRPFHPALFALSAALPLVALSDTATWIGGTGNWTDAAKWSTGVAPETPAEGEDPVDVVIDGDAGVVSAVTLTTSATSGDIAVGSVRVDAGDSLTMSRSGDGNSRKISLAGLENAGLLTINAAANNNDRALTIEVCDHGFVNREGGILAVNNQVSNRNRVHAAFECSAASTNDGTVVISTRAHDRNDVYIRFTTNGMFVNNGLVTMLLTGTENPAKGTGIGFVFNDQTDNGYSSILGNGKIVLSISEERTPEGNTGYMRMQSNAATLTVTNGPYHTIEGSGTIEKFALVNAGLVRACGTNWSLSVQGTITDSNGKALENLVSGRMVADGPGGLYLGANSSNPSRFVNQGLVEARTDSFVAFRGGVTHSTTKVQSNIPATIQLDGTFAGGGEFRPPRPLQLTADATLSPGDLANTDGTGASTAGTLTFTTNLVLSAGTTLDFQFGRLETGDYDAVVVDGALTLAGTLRVSALNGIRPSGTYRIFSCTPGELTGDLGSLTKGEIELPSSATSLTLDVPGGLPEPTLNVDPETGTVDAYFPPPETVILFR